MRISTTEFQMNMNKYLSLVSQHDILITKDGQDIAKLTSPSADRVSLLDNLVGIAKAGDISDDTIKRERLDDE